MYVSATTFTNFEAYRPYKQDMIMSIKITGVGSYIPDRVEKNSDFQKHEFLYEDGSTFDQSNTVIIEKFKAITGIAERRYIHSELNNSDIAYLAANKAIEDAKDRSGRTGLPYRRA